MNIRKGDTVKIMKGKDRGKTGAVIRVFRDEGRVSVENLNVVKKHVRPKKQGEKGQVVGVPRPLSLSNVQIICSSCNRPVRVGFEMRDGKKVRYCKKCKAALEK